MSAWTDERIGQMRDMAKQGFSAAVIAQHLGVSRHAVIGKIHRMKGAGGQLTAKRHPEPAKTAAMPSAEKSAAKKPAPAVAPAQASKALAVRGASLPATLFAPGDAASIIVVPMPYLRALHEGRCLFFAADPMTPGGPDMPVCGCRRAADARKPYCAAHLAAEPSRRSAP